MMTCAEFRESFEDVHAGDDPWKPVHQAASDKNPPMKLRDESLERLAMPIAGTRGPIASRTPHNNELLTILP